MINQSPFLLLDWRIEPDLNRIIKGSRVKKLEPQVMNVLLFLSRHQGHVVTKEQLAQKVWTDLVITENVITRAISNLRKALEDEPTAPRYIETISKSGYRLLPEVRPAEPSSAGNRITIRLKRRPVIIVTAVIVFMALGAFAIRQTFIPQTVQNAYHPRALANMSNSEYWPAISPDGRFVAYSWKGPRDNNWDIYARLIGTETRLRITNNKATDLRPKWSHDGNFVYFLRYENGGSTIYKQSVLGGQEVRITSSPQGSSGDFDVSPDGRWISFNERNDPSSALRITLIGLETGEVKYLSNPINGQNGDIHPRFSPAGKQVAFIREKNPAAMYLFIHDLFSGETRQVSFDPVSINGFDWSKEGKSLVYSCNRSGLYKLWELNTETAQSTVIKAGDDQMVMPRVAATGRIVYAKMNDNVNLWEYDIRKKVAKTWYASNDLDLNLTYSPNDLIASFTKPSEGKFQIWTASNEGEDLKPITQFFGKYLSAPRWSADGEDLFFRGIVGDQSDIFKVNAHGGIPENLTNTSDLDEKTPFISENGSLYYSRFTEGDWGVWEQDLEGESQELISGLNAFAPQLHPDGSKLYFARKDTLGIWSYHLTEEVTTLVVDSFHPMYWGAFTVNSQGLYYFNARNRQFELHDLKTGENTPIFKPTGRIPRMGITLSVSTDQNRLYYSQIDHHDADIMLLEEDNSSL